MFFVNSWMLVLGAAAALVPVMIHWLTRPRPVVRPLSTIRFVMQAVSQRRARRRLRDLVILATRSAAVLLLAAALARPIAGRRPPARVDAPGLATRVVVLDVSQSMAAQVQGIEAIERARPVAARQLAFGPGLAAGLVLAGARARSAFDRPSTNFAALRDEVGRATPRPERLNVQAALSAAARILAQAASGGGSAAARRSELVIVSDFQRTQWATADFAIFPRETTIQLESTAGAATPPNLAVVRIGGQSRAELGRALTIEVDVGNFSPAARLVEVELALENASYRMSGPCAAGAKTTLSTEVVPRAAGWQTGRATLVGTSDALAEDDSRSFALFVRSPPVFALVTRQSADGRVSSSYYLERALVPTAAIDPGPDRPSPRVVRFDPEHLDRDALAGADLVALDHPGRLEEETLASLSRWLRRGRSVLYVACEPADAGNIERLAELAGADLRLPVTFAPRSDDAARTARFIADARGELPPFDVFGDALTATLAPLRFAGALISRPLPGDLADDVRASFGDRSACLVITTCGAGTISILNADLGASNLPTSPAFVPLIGELTTLLLGRRSVEAPVACGEPFALPLPADAGPRAGLTVVHGPEARRETAGRAVDERDEAATDIVEEPEGLVARQFAAGPPGTVRIKRGGQTVFALATALPEQESDLAPLSASVLQTRLASDRAVTYRDAAQADDAEESLWAVLACGCALVLAVELVLLRVLRT